jgi:DNA-binding MarR family transcriptional regulator
MIRICDIIHVTQTIDAQTTAPADPEGSARDLATAIIADFRATMTQLKCASSERLLREGVSMAQVHIMYTVQRHGEMTMSQLADVLNVSDSNATGLVDRLAERGLVVRDRVPEDRRVVVVKATDAGERLLREVDALSDDILRSVLDRLDAGQLLGVGQAIADLRAAVDAVVGLEAHRHPVSTTAPRSTTSLRGADLANHHHKEGIDH